MMRVKDSLKHALSFLACTAIVALSSFALYSRR